MRKSILFFLVLSVFLSSLSFSGFFSAAATPRNNISASDSIPDTDEANPYLLLLSEAEKAIADSNYVEAIKRFRDALNIKPDEPTNFMIYSNMGELYSRIGKDSLACDAWSKAIDIAEFQGHTQNWLLGKRARGYLRLGRDIEAFDDFSEILETDSINGEARYLHGLIALYGGNLKIATSDFDILKKYYPESLATAKALGLIYSMTERDEEALPYLEEVIKKSPSPEYYAALAGCQLKLGRLPDASSTIGQGLREYPADPELYYYRAWLNKELYRLNEAREDAKSAIKLGANPAKVNALF